MHKVKVPIDLNKSVINHKVIIKILGSMKVLNILFLSNDAAKTTHRMSRVHKFYTMLLSAIVRLCSSCSWTSKK